METKDFKKERSTLERAVRALIEPFLHDSGYSRHAFTQGRKTLRLWTPRNLAGKATLKTYVIPGGFVLRELEGFTEQGVITDSTGGGMAVLGWSQLPVEDLARLARWMGHMLPKLTRYEEACKTAAVRAKQKYANAVRASKARTTQQHCSL